MSAATRGELSVYVVGAVHVSRTVVGVCAVAVTPDGGFGRSAAVRNENWRCVPSAVPGLHASLAAVLTVTVYSVPVESPPVVIVRTVSPTVHARPATVT